VTCHCHQDPPLERSVRIGFYIFHFFVFFNLINENKNANIFVWYHVLTVIFLCRRRSTMTRRVPMTSMQGPRR
jgi:hypothetical protein